MKKVSTAAAKQSRNISQQKLTIGLDLGDRNSWGNLGTDGTFPISLLSSLGKPVNVPSVPIFPFHISPCQSQSAAEFALFFVQVVEVAGEVGLLA
jgi:hypothetical protein